MSIRVRTYNDFKNNDIGSIEIEDGARDYRYTSPMLGKNTPDYTIDYAQFQLWNLENYASEFGPPNPQPGMLWYDNVRKMLNLCTSVTPPYWTAISSPPLGDQLSSSDLLPSEDSTYNLGSKEKPWDDVYVAAAYTGNLYLKKADGTYTDVVDVLNTTSDEVIHDQTIMGFLPSGVTLTAVLNELYNGAATSEIVTITTNTNLLPKKNAVYKVDSTSNITITIMNRTSGALLGDQFSITNVNSGEMTITIGSNIEISNVLMPVSNVECVVFTLTKYDSVTKKETWTVYGGVN